MHPSVREWVEAQAERLPLDASSSVLDVGSYDVNGTVRDLFDGIKNYTGLDKRPGPGVDVVGDIEDPGRDLDLAYWFDVVVCCEMLEHTPRPWRAFRNMAARLKRGGTLLLTTRAPGFGIHEHPGDYYRFTQDAVAVLANLAGLVDVITYDDPDPLSPGVFLRARRP